ncbi:MAG: 3-hydroxyacyl-ACP dehydratase FabZ [Thermodesulfobacteriota bacterium]
MTDLLRAVDALPHTYPFRLIDRILELEEGRGVGIKNVTINDPFFQGHFKENPIMPGVLIVETMAQMAGLVLHYGKEKGDKKATFIARIKDIKFKRSVLPGDQIKITVETVLTIASMSQFSVKALVEEDIVAEGEIVLAFEETRL